MSSVLDKIRNKLIDLLAGNRPVALNCRIDDGSLVVGAGDRAFLKRNLNVAGAGIIIRGMNVGDITLKAPDDLPAGTWMPDSSYRHIHLKGPDGFLPVKIKTLDTPEYSEGCPVEIWRDRQKRLVLVTYAHCKGGNKAINIDLLASCQAIGCDTIDFEGIPKKDQEEQ